MFLSSPHPTYQETSIQEAQVRFITEAYNSYIDPAPQLHFLSWKKCLITMIDRTHSTILNFKFQLWFLSTGFYIIKCPERTLSVMSSYKMSIQSIKKYLFMCFYNLPEEAHIKWQVTKQQKTYIFLFPPIFPKCAPFLTVSVNLSSNCFCIISKW